MDIPQSTFDLSLITACMENDMRIIKSLLTEKKGRKANIQARGNDPLHYACKFGHLKLVKYLLSSPELTEHADIYANKADIFRSLVSNSSKNKQEAKDIIHYLIFEYNLEKNGDIREMIGWQYNSREYQEELNNIEKMFNIRDATNKLEN